MCRRNEQGEIIASGPQLMKGYWQQDDVTAETIKNGWLFTGDLGYQDDEGYIFLTGRAKDFIKRAGEMISPEEVEQTLMSHPAVDEAAIIGIPDDEWGERVRAVVVLKIRSERDAGGSHRVLPKAAGQLQEAGACGVLGGAPAPQSTGQGSEAGPEADVHGADHGSGVVRLTDAQGRARGHYGTPAPFSRPIAHSRSVTLSVSTLVKALRRPGFDLTANGEETHG